jgi:large subunit ribosomal protein L10
MAVSKAKKAEILATLEAHLKDATSIGFTSNKKVSVAEVSALKKDLRAHDTTFMLAKKTLICIAFKNVYNVDLDINTLPGQVAIIISKGDKIAGLGIVNKYAKEWKKEEKITFVGGYLDGRVMGAEETAKLAGLPSREVLLAKLLGSMMSPLSGFARFLDGAKKELEGKSLTKVGDLKKETSAE